MIGVGHSAKTLLAAEMSALNPQALGNEPHHQIFDLGGDQLWDAGEIEGGRQIRRRPRQNEKGVLIVLRFQIIPEERMGSPVSMTRLHLILIDRRAIGLLLLKRRSERGRSLARRSLRAHPDGRKLREIARRPMIEALDRVDESGHRQIRTAQLTMATRQSFLPCRP